LIAAFVIALLGGGAGAYAMEVDLYLDGAQKTLKAVKRGKARDADKLIAQQRELIRLAVEGCLEFAEKRPMDAKMMHLVVLNSQRMQNLTLEQIDEEWLKGGYLRSHGVDVDRFSPTDAQVIYQDAVVRPALAIIALQQYKRTKDPEFLKTVHDALSAVVDNLAALN
jgi:hypothetical protein